jgi:hypothetical protein
MLKDKQIEEIKKLARESAKDFVDEFDEELDTEDTDWDTDRWSDVDSGRLSFSEELEGDDWDEAYEIYRDALFDETKKLSKKE